MKNTIPAHATTALILVDVTPTFMPGGELPVTEGDQIIAPITRLATEVDFDLVVDAREEHPANHISFAINHNQEAFTTKLLGGATQMLWPVHALEGTENAKLHTALRDFVDTTLFKGLRNDVECYGAFAYADGVPTGLRNVLNNKGIKKVVIVGLATDYCVGTTALQAAAAGYETEVILEACRGVNPLTTKEMLGRLTAAGVAQIKTVDEFIQRNPAITEDNARRRNMLEYGIYG